MGKGVILALPALLLYEVVTGLVPDPPQIHIEDSVIRLSWNGEGALYRSDSPDGTWTGPLASESPYETAWSPNQFFRLLETLLQYPIVDTNQAEAYDESGNVLQPAPGTGEKYSGQDAFYTGNQPDYQDNGDGTVTDRVTGLMWQQEPPEAFYSWTEAQAYAAQLKLAGHDDWRLPTMKELFSLADFTGSSRPKIKKPYINTDFFTVHDPLQVTTFFPPGTAGEKRDIDGQYWSGEAYVGRTINDDSATFGFNFIDGRIKGYPDGIERGPTGTAFVRCVRGSSRYGRNSFTDNGDGTVTDSATGLMWLKNDSGAWPEAGSRGNGTMDWIEALAWAEDLDHAGYDDWRLPNAKELHSLVDYTRAPDAMDPEKRTAAIDPVFNVTEVETWNWTSTSLGDDLFAWALYVCFGRALAVDVQTGLPTVNAHGAGAMRSDPKTGSPEDFIGLDGGHGPQNDQVRIFNHVRPVRTATTETEPDSPNILLVIVDDWGIDSSSLYNTDTEASLPPMPNISSLASRGLLLENAYALPTCSPTRATMITGRYPSRHGIGVPVTPGSVLPVEEYTLPDVFQLAGSPYALAAFGKWHLTAGLVKDIRNTPNTTGGWPHYAGCIGGAVDDYYDWTKVENGVVTRNVTDYPTSDTVNDAIEWIQARGRQPWFAWVAFNAAHTPFHDPPAALHGYADIPDEITGRWRRTAYEAALEAFDAELGRLLESVDLEETYVIVLGDNGTPGTVVQSPYTWDRAKGSLYEGGTHVPMILAGPGVVVHGSSQHLIHCVDIFDTMLELAGIDYREILPAGTRVDSRSLVSVWQSNLPVRDFVFCEAFANDNSTAGQFLRDDRYKLLRLEGMPDQFFDLLESPDESENLLESGMLPEEQSHYELLSGQLDAILDDF